MNLPLFSFVRHSIDALVQAVKQRLRQWTKPDNHTLVLNAALDLTRSKSELMLENALLRQQLIVLQRQAKRPALTWRDRTVMVLLASKLRSWRDALMIVQPDTLLRWHRDLFRRVWRRKSKSQGKRGRKPLTDQEVALIKRLAKDNPTWGAKRIQGELLKLGIESARPSPPGVRRLQEPVCPHQRLPPPPGAPSARLGSHRHGIA